MHGPILRTPDTKAGETDPERLYADNVAYLDKQVGDLVAHIDRLGLREKTLILFSDRAERWDAEGKEERGKSPEAGRGDVIGELNWSWTEKPSGRP